MLIKTFRKLFTAKEQDIDDIALSHRTELASAALMIEVARSDFDASDIELQTVIAHLKDSFEITPAELESLTARAHDSVEASASLYEFTRVVNDNLDLHAKRELIAMMWRVAFADGELSKYEEHLIRRVADLIYVAHSDFIQLKHAAEEAL